MPSPLDALFALAEQTLKLGTRVWPPMHGGAPEETWDEAWKRIYGELVPDSLARFYRNNHSVRIFSRGRVVISELDGETQIYQLRSDSAAPTALERSAELFQSSILEKIGSFLDAPPGPSKREQ